MGDAPATLDVRSLTELTSLPIGHDPRVEDPWLEYARLRSQGDEFVRDLSAIARHSLWELRAERVQLPLQYVRRADRQTALAALRNSGLLTVLAHGDSSATPMTALAPFDVPVARKTLDSAGNRCIAAVGRGVAISSTGSCDSCNASRHWPMSPVARSRPRA